MIKYALLLSLLFCTLLSLESQAQFRLSLEASPSLISNRLASDSDSIRLDSDGTAVKIRLALMAEVPITEYYFFNVGIAYSPERAGISLRNQNITQAYDLQYIQLPAMLKLLTSELSIDTRLYFTVGAIPEILINDDTSFDDPVITKFRAYDASLHLGGGIVRKLGTQTEVYGGVSYNRGLINVIAESIPTDEPLVLKNDMLRLDIGIRF